jgi:hypothetical protein
MEEAERENAKAIGESTRAYEQLKAAGQQVYEATRTPLEQLGAEQARLNDLLQKGAIDWDTYSRAVFNAQDAFDATTARAAQAGDELSQFARTAAANIQTTLGDSLFAAMNGRFNDIGAAFTQMLNRMVAEALAAKLTEALLGSAGAGGGTSSSGGLIQAIGLFFGGAKASGGDVIGGRSYLVGEEGPEMFVPRTTGLILPANQARAAGGRSTTINNSFTVSGQVDRRTQEQIAADAGRAIQRALARGGA